MYYVCVCLVCPQKSEEGIRHSETGVKDGCEPSYGAGNQTQELAEAARTLNGRVISPAPCKACSKWSQESKLWDEGFL